VVRTPIAEDMEKAAAASVWPVRVAELTRWVAEGPASGRKLTQTGRLTMADARHLVERLGTGDVIDPVIGDRTFKTKSSEELTELRIALQWARAAGLVRRRGNSSSRSRSTPGWRTGRRTLWVPETSQQLRDLRILMDQATESIASDYRRRGVRRYRGERSKRRCLSQGPVRAMGVEVGLVLAQHLSGMCGVDDQDPVQQFTPDAADEPFADRVRHRHPDRDLDHVSVE
jgi:hypothetical protein